MKKIVSEDRNCWKIVLIKTIENREPIYYRIVNLYDFSIRTIPAYRIFDEVVNEGLNIINLRCDANKPRVIDESGYDSTEGIIIIDEFDNEIDNVFDWCLDHSGIGNHILSKFDSEKNAFSPGSYRIDEPKKIAWTCKNNHTIHCGFSTFFSLNGRCPICEREENDEIPSFEYWCHITDNTELLEQYNLAEENLKQADSISYRTHTLVWFYDKINDKKEQEFLDTITVDGKKLFVDNKVTLKRVKKKDKSTGNKTKQAESKKTTAAKKTKSTKK